MIRRISSGKLPSKKEIIINEVDMVRLYITRHGETLWNTQKRMQGHKDSELTQKGERQAQLLAKSLDDIAFEAIYSSSSGRTMQTSQILAGNRDIPIIPMDSLREINLGEWEGQIFSEVEEVYPKEYKNFWEFPHQYTPVGGEDFTHILQRIDNTLQSLIKQHDGKNIMIVTHTVVLKVIMMIIEKKELKYLWSGPFIHQTSLSVVEFNNEKWSPVKWGDTSHLESESWESWGRF